MATHNNEGDDDKRNTYFDFPHKPRKSPQHAEHALSIVNRRRQEQSCRRRFVGSPWRVGKAEACVSLVVISFVVVGSHFVLAGRILLCTFLLPRLPFLFPSSSLPLLPAPPPPLPPLHPPHTPQFQKAPKPRTSTLNPPGDVSNGPKP